MPPRADAFEPDIDSLLAKLATTPATLPPPLSDHAEQAAKRSRSGGLFALSFLLNSSALVLLVALAVGLVSSLKPTLFLTIPHVGFVPWMLSGHPLPPDQDGTPLQAQYFHTWAKPGDVMVATGARSGQVWLLNIVHLLLHEAHDDGYDRLLSDVVSTAEFKEYPDHSLMARILDSQRVRSNSPSTPLVHASHRAPSPGTAAIGIVPAHNPHLKYISCVRSGMEETMSVYAFLQTYPDELRALWGGFPPPLESPEATVGFIMDHHHPDAFFDFAKSWWDVRDEPNVLLLHFNELKNESRMRTIERIADFLELHPVSDQLLGEVYRKSSYEYMRARNEASPGVYSNVIRDRQGHATDMHLLMGAHYLVERGQYGKGDEYAQIRPRWELAVEKHWGGEEELARWAEGG